MELTPLNGYDRKKGSSDGGRYLPAAPTFRERGQAIVITAVAFLAILAFVGLVTDVATLYLNFTRLKRALDSAAVAAANNIRDSSLSAAQRKANIQEAAREMLAFNDIANLSSMEAYVCDEPGIPPDFAQDCPGPGEDKRKLAWVQATQYSPVYFLQLFGVEGVPITTHSIGEAATLDVVVVIDNSESMASETSDYDPLDYDPDGPSGCNTTGTCQPLQDAKNGAKAMVDKFFDGYDRVAVVTYNVRAVTHDPDPSDVELLEADHTAVKSTIDGIQLFDGPSLGDILPYGDPRYGEMNPMDINGDGVYYQEDDIIGSTCTGCGIRVAGDILEKQGRTDSVWVIVLLSDGTTNVSDLPPGVGDPNSPVPAGNTNGYCGGNIGSRLWTNEPGTSYSWCTDSNPKTRHCGPYHGGPSECPPDQYGAPPPPYDKGVYVQWTGNNSPPYDTDDYAYDMTDRVALVHSANPNEPTPGEDIAIYTIGLGKAADPPDYDGEALLRYMANVGDDNARNPVPDIPGDEFPKDPCDGAPAKSSCGQYYYAKTGAYLQAIYEKIAGSIFTRISE